MASLPSKHLCAKQRFLIRINADTPYCQHSNEHSNNKRLLKLQQLIDFQQHHLFQQLPTIQTSREIKWNQLRSAR
jgi:hypothetical protein